jgi:hypothetical protein
MPEPATLALLRLVAVSIHLGRRNCVSEGQELDRV